MPEISIREAPDVEDFAAQLIDEHHPHLETARILYLFTTQRRKKCDRTRLASAAKLSALMRYLSSGPDGSVAEGYDFLILVDIKEWGFLTPDGRRALVDHELCHCARREKVSKRGKVTYSWALRGHDVEEFQAVIERHGLWRSDVKEFVDSGAKQLALSAVA